MHVFPQHGTPQQEGFVTSTDIEGRKYKSRKELQKWFVMESTNENMQISGSTTEKICMIAKIILK